ncbi:peptidoglycan-binding protein [Rhizobium johnstonii]|uniref:peptidoglycan-binding domain-containing protein n=1 Tax=Rhizobium johnstonii TaxID=3019933 RepID=UPI003F991E4D
MHLKRLIVVLGWAASVALAPLPGAAGVMYDFTPTGLLTPAAAHVLPFAPAAVTAFDDVVFAAGAADGKGEILRLDASTLQISATQGLDIVPSAMVANFGQTHLFLIGTQEDGRTRIEVRDTNLNPVGKITVEVPMLHSSLTMTKNNVLVVGSLPGSVGPGAVIAFDMSRPDEPRPLPDLLPDAFGRTGVARAWFDDTAGGTLFVNTALPPSLIAVATEGKAAGGKLSSLNFDDPAPVPMVANLSSRPCLTDEAIAWFLIASSAKLFLAAYDPASSFKSLDIVSLTETNLNIEGKSDPPYYDDTKVTMSAYLLASSCDMGVIWIGDRNSRQVEQFAVNPKADPPTLEKVGQFLLDEAPDRLVMTTSGQHGYTVSARTNTLTRFDAGGGEVTGTETARTLQRLLTEKGFSVGPIDGQVGVRTLDAITRFERSNNVTLDINRDLKRAFETLQAAPAQ